MAAAAGCVGLLAMLSTVCVTTVSGLAENVFKENFWVAIYLVFSSDMGTCAKGSSRMNFQVIWSFGAMPTL